MLSVTVHRAAEIILLVLLIQLPDRGFAADRQAGKKRPVVTMTRPLEVSAGSVQIDGGSKQDVTRWPATLKFFWAKRLACTSTIVGEHVILTAAHCITADTIFSVDLGNGPPFEITCDRNPKFERPTLKGDVALCFSATAFPQTIGFENLDLNSASVRENQRLFLLGYGCRSVINLDQTGQLYGGSSKIVKLPTASDDHALSRGGVVICPGDSGGAAYVLAVEDQPVNPRSIVGINSSYEVATRTSDITSFTGPIGDFIRGWAKDKGVLICGVHPTAPACHDQYTP
jgi:Trypsin